MTPTRSSTPASPASLPRFGGVRWYRYKAKKPTRFLSWNQLDG
ncbi:MAG: hypothetical protein ACRERD_23815 [Candidatus Binatia bacterium]